MKLFLFSIISVFSSLAVFASNEEKPSPDSIVQLLEIIDRKNDLLSKDTYYYLNKADSLIKSTGNNDSLAALYIKIGKYYWLYGDFLSSAEYLLRSIDAAEAKGDNYNLALAYRNLGETYRSSKDFKESLEYLEKAAELYKLQYDDAGIAATYNRMAATHFEVRKGDYLEEAQVYAELSNNIAVKNKNDELMANNYNILGAVKRDNGDYKQAITYFRKGLTKIPLEKHIHFYATIMSNIGDTWYRTGNPDSAIFYANIAYDYCNEHNLRYQATYPAIILSRAHSLKGQFEEGLYFHEQASGIQDSLFYESKNKLLAALKERYESQKKDSEIAKQKLIQYYQMIIFGIIILLSIALGYVLYNRHKALKRINRLISDKNKQLNELNAHKDKFFSIIAHDLINPIDAFRKLVDEMLDDYENFDHRTRKEFLNLMRTSSYSILELLNNLLIWSRSQLGKIEFQPVQINIKELIEENINLLKLQAEEKNVLLEVMYDGDSTAFADRNMLNSILRNLVTNAIKFTENGGKVELKLNNRNGAIQLLVSDTGIGMSQKQIDGLFSIEYVNSSRGTNNEKGTGLGLMITKEFVDTHAGNINVESSEGKGTKITVTIPHLECKK